MAGFFETALEKARRISGDDFVTNFGGIAEDVVEMLGGEHATMVRKKARASLEENGDKEVRPGVKALQKVVFGELSKAPELMDGKVAAIDGRPALPLQMYTAGQSLCVGVGSVTYRRELATGMHYWSTQMALEGNEDIGVLKSKTEGGLFSIKPSAFMRFFEAAHGLEVEEEFVMFDGPIVDEWLLTFPKATNQYRKLIEKKKCIDIIKNIKANIKMAWIASALNAGELYLYGSLHDLLTDDEDRGESRFAIKASKDFINDIGSRLIRGVFKPRNKAFGFEVDSEHLGDLLRIMSADCQLNYPGHEIPYLLNRIDEKIGRQFSTEMLKNRISAGLMKSSEGLFFDEVNERDFRAK